MKSLKALSPFHHLIDPLSQLPSLVEVVRIAFPITRTKFRRVAEMHKTFQNDLQMVCSLEMDLVLGIVHAFVRVQRNCFSFRAEGGSGTGSQILNCSDERLMIEIYGASKPGICRCPVDFLSAGISGCR